MDKEPLPFRVQILTILLGSMAGFILGSVLTVLIVLVFLRIL